MELRINTGLIDRVTNIFSKSDLPSIHPEREKREETTEISSNLAAFYYAKMVLETTRKARLADYRLMDEEYVEIASACDMYADMAAKEIDEDGNVVEFTSDDKKAFNILEELFDRVRIQESLWDTGRNIVKMGDEFDEMIVDDSDLIVKLKPLPLETMTIDTDEFGHWKDKPYVQKNPAGTGEIAKFEPWQIIHWKLGGTKKLYGDSLLRPLRRVYKQLQMMEDGIVIGRLTKSMLRYLFVVDTEGMSKEDRDDEVEKVKNAVKKRRLINSNTGQLETRQNPLSQNEDFFLAATKEGKADVKVLQGASNLGNINDVIHFQDKLWIGLKTPKVLFGIQDVKARAVAMEQAIQLAVAVGRVRKSLRHGLAKLSDRQLVLQGVMPQKGLYQINFAPMSTVDAMRQATTDKLKAEVAQIYRGLGIPLTDEFIMSNYAGISDEDIAKLLKAKKEDITQSIKATASKIKDNLALRASSSAGVTSPQVTGTQPKAEGGDGEDNAIEMMGLIEQLRELVSLELNS